jgi:hypothetical protein
VAAGAHVVDDRHFLRGDVLDLHPLIGTTGLVGRLGTLADDALIAASLGYAQRLRSVPVRA